MTKGTASKAVADLLSRLSEWYPNFRPSDATAIVWSEVLGGVSAAKLQGIADTLRLREAHRDFAPPLPAFEQAIKGRIVKVPVYPVDNFGSRMIDAKPERWVEILVPPGEDPPAKIWRNEKIPERYALPAASAPQQLPQHDHARPSQRAVVSALEDLEGRARA